tara:strand:- start:963 stop:1814 length:852 start_codon:yes stop_codon:yes gene_type:complete
MTKTQLESLLDNYVEGEDTETDREEVKPTWETEEEWKKYGIENEFNKKNPHGLQKGQKYERSWYQKGVKRGWIRNFSFNKKKDQKSRWKTEEEWRQYGLGKGYHKRSPSSFRDSIDEIERKWYCRGSNQKWCKNFDFNRNLEWDTFEEWEYYGIDNGYNQDNAMSILNGDDEKSRKWYKRGEHKKWISEFTFNSKRLPNGTWKELNYILEKALEAIDENGWDELPGGTKLCQIGYGALATSIHRYHGGFLAFREKLREYIGQPRETESDQLESLLDDYVGGSE